MDGSHTPAPFRDARYAPRRLDVERLADGGVVLTNPTPWSDRFLTTTAALDHWAAAAPDRLPATLLRPSTAWCPAVRRRRR